MVMNYGKAVASYMMETSTQRHTPRSLTMLCYASTHYTSKLIIFTQPPIYHEPKIMGGSSPLNPPSYATAQ